MRLSKKTIYAIILMLSIVKWEESEVITIKAKYLTIYSKSDMEATLVTTALPPF